MERTVLFSTVHGSHLYGLAHEGSDRDTYTVVTRAPHVAHNGSRARCARQRITGTEDEFVIDLSTFLLLCEKGVPQALEAMWSPVPTYDALSALRAGYRASTHVIPTYLRTIKSFMRAGDYKRRRHALRLALNARDILHYGFFNPRLTREEVALVNRLAHKDNAETLALALVWT